MLFACLQSQAVSRVSIGIFGNADDTSGDGTLVFVFRGEECSGRTTVEHRDTEALAATEYDIRSPFSRRGEQGEAQNVGGNGHFATGSMCIFHKSAVVFYIAVAIRVL